MIQYSSANLYLAPKAGKMKIEIESGLEEVLIAGKTMVRAQVTMVKVYLAYEKIDEEVFKGKIPVGTIISTFLNSRAIVLGRLAIHPTAATPSLPLKLRKIELGLLL